MTSGIGIIAPSGGIAPTSNIGKSRSSSGLGGQPQVGGPAEQLAGAVQIEPVAGRDDRHPVAAGEGGGRRW